MKITMLENRRGSENGFTVRSFERGQTYDLADSLARSFIRNGWATETRQSYAVNTGMSCQVIEEGV